MKVGVLLTFLILFVAICTGQTAIPICQKVKIDTPGSGYMRKGGTYHVSASVENYYPSAPELTFEWKLPERPHFNISPNGFGASFVASEDLDGLEVVVGLISREKSGNCRSESTATFQILFNPGSPLILDEYDSLSLKEENVRLDAVAAELLRNDYNAIILIRHRTGDSKSAIDARVRRIENHLIGTRRIPQDRLTFAFMESKHRSVTVYAQPRKKS